MSTKFEPKKGRPGKDFEIEDEPEARILPGSFALFLQAGAEVARAPIDSKDNGEEGEGRIPDTLATGATYRVEVDNGQVRFYVADFYCKPPSDHSDNHGQDDDIATVEPLDGAPGTPFVITDTEKDLEPDDRVLFVAPGGDLASGVPAESVTFVDKRRIEGVVPPLPGGVTYAIWVVPQGKQGSRYREIAFVVPPDATQAPTISPTSATPNAQVTISDAAGRIQTGDNLFFLSSGLSIDPLPIAGLAPTVAPGGTSIRATVPQLPAGSYGVTVRATATSQERFAPLPLTVNPLPDASISPSSGAVGTTFTIADNGGRIQPGDQALFYLPGDNPATGTPAVAVSLAGNSALSGTVPNVPVGNDYFVAVRPTPTAPSRFNDLPFTVA